MDEETKKIKRGRKMSRRTASIYKKKVHSSLLKLKLVG